MMAFFLLLWLLNATTEEQKMGISNYFDPTAISRSTRSGSGGVLGGTSITVPGALKSASSPPMLSQPSVARPQAENIESRLGSDQDEEGTISQADIERLLQERESAQFAQAEQLIRKAVAEAAGEDSEISEDIGDSLRIDYAPEGLRIQLLDQEKVALFPLGSADMFDQTKKLLEKVAEIIKKLPNKIKISGHTDSRKFAPGSATTTWELSTRRANSSRRALVELGVDAERIAQVVGMADRDPIEPTNSAAASNRRISIVLMRDALSGPKLDTNVAGANAPRDTALPFAVDDGTSTLPLKQKPATAANQNTFTLDSAAKGG
jgi:chemotaxis protein MotB